MRSSASTVDEVSRAAGRARTLADLDGAICRCQACPRLVDWCRQTARERRAAYRDQEYWGGPVPGFGDEHPSILIIGLAPAAHGANRTGRMFTGDRSGDWLFGALHRVGLAALPTSVDRSDGQQLRGVRITAAVHCAPPGNSPSPQEFAACAHWLQQEWSLVASTTRVVLALGGLAWTASLKMLRAAGGQVPKTRFGHGAQAAVRLGDRTVTLVGSYHPSQQNTFTGRLTEHMLDTVLARARELSGQQPL